MKKCLKPLVVMVLFVQCSNDMESPMQAKADFAASHVVIKTGQSVTFTDLSTGNPISWSWIFDGADPATSNEQNPVITYQSAGSYSVTLEVSNGDSEDTETKENFIVVEVAEEETNQLKWEKASSFPGANRRQAAGFAMGDKFYTGFGYGPDGVTFINSNDFYEYDLGTNTWTKKANLPDNGRFDVAAFSIGNKGYVGFGKSLVNCNSICEHVYYNDLWEYDPTLDSWKKIATYDEVIAPQTTVSKSFVINDKAYLVFINGIWVYDPVDKSLTKIGELPSNMIVPTGFALNNKIYLGAGGIPNLQKTFYEFDPENKIWTKKADLPGEARRFAAGFAIDGYGYIACGEGAKEVSPGSFQVIGLKDAWRYDPALDAWTKFDDYPGLGLIYQISCEAGDKALVGTGFNYGAPSSYEKDFWLVR